MAGRPIFKGVIHVNKTEVPVKLYSAVRKERVSFRLLHKKDKERLQQKMYCSKEDKPIEQDERARGYEVTKGQYVVLDPDEIKELRPETDRKIDVMHFVDEDEIDPRLYDRPYYLGPDGQKNKYAMLARALSKTDRVAVVSWVMRGKSYVGIVKPLDDLLLLVTMRYVHEVIPVDTLELKHPRVKKKELSTANDLIDELSETFDPSNYQNEHQQRIMHFIEQKAKGKKPKTKRPKRKKPTKPSELQEKLEKSLREARAS